MKSKILSILLLFVLSMMVKPLMANLWFLSTENGYLIPSESSIFSFKVIKMNSGSGGWWLLGEDDKNIYIYDEKSKHFQYVVIKKEDLIN